MATRNGRTAKRDSAEALSTLTTSTILTLHDRLIGRLDGPARARMLRAARERGWDRTWDDGPLAA